MLNKKLSKVQLETSEEEIEQKLSTLNTLKGQQKVLFFTIIEKFFEVLTVYLVNSEVKVEDGEKGETNKNPNWFKWASERFEDFLLIVNFLSFSFA